VRELQGLAGMRKPVRVKYSHPVKSGPDSARLEVDTRDHRIRVIIAALAALATDLYRTTTEEETHARAVR